ncbi:MAG: hypothetical protein ACK4TA_10565 [Saprospiraceae bacterium]
MNINLFSQNVGIINIDSVATYSVIEDSSFIFCNQVGEVYLKKGKILIDSFTYKYTKFFKDHQTIHASAEYFDSQQKELQELQQIILDLEKDYYNTQHILNETIYNFTIQEIYNNRKIIESQLALHFLITVPPIYADFNQSNVKIINVTQEVINIINNSTSFKENWLLFKSQIKLSE